MKSPDGENHMRLIYKRRKLEKKVRSEMYKKEAALVQVSADRLYHQAKFEF